MTGLKARNQSHRGKGIYERRKSKREIAKCKSKKVVHETSFFNENNLHFFYLQHMLSSTHLKEILPILLNLLLPSTASTASASFIQGLAALSDPIKIFDGLDHLYSPEKF